MQDSIKSRASDLMNTSKRFFNKITQSKIKPYDGDDSVYTGNDSDYQEFLKNIKKGESSSDAVSTKEKEEEVIEENTVEKEESNCSENKDDKSFSINEVLSSLKKKTIDKADELNIIKNVDNELQKTLDGLVNKIEAISGKQDLEALKDSVDSQISLSENINNKVDVLSEAVKELETHSEAHDAKIEDILNHVDNSKEDMYKKISTLAEVQLDIKAQNAQNRAQLETLILSIEKVREKVGEIYQTTTIMDKLNDSVFQLKRAQLETKNALNELENQSGEFSKKIFNSIMLLSGLVGIAIIIMIVQIFL